MAAAAPVQTQAPAATQTAAPAAPVTATAPVGAPVGAEPYQAQHTVGARESIWSIAHRYSAPYNNVNEFQAVASIYRNNQNSFENGNVNQIRRGSVLNIPAASQMALEQTQTGSDLLSNGTTTLPPLNAAPTQMTAQNNAAPGLATAQNASSPIGSANDMNGAGVLRLGRDDVTRHRS